MKAMLVASAALLVAASGAVAQEMTEIEKPASEINEVLAHETELDQGTQQVRVVRVTVDPRTIAGWHTHPTPVYVYVAEGELVMEVEGQEDRVIHTGEAVAEPLDSPMRVRNEGEVPAEIVVFQISPAEKEFLEQD